jgi:hypothetical protein
MLDVHVGTGIPVVAPEDAVRAALAQHLEHLGVSLGLTDVVAAYDESVSGCDRLLHRVPLSRMA